MQRNRLASGVNRALILTGAVLGGLGVSPAAGQAEGEDAGAAGVGGLMSDRATYAFGGGRAHSEPEVLWPGFLNGLRGFEHFYEPIGNPIYFESPTNVSGLRALYLYHKFPEDSTIDGGHLSVYALQARLALTERLAFIATKDGYSDLNAGLLPHDEGWNDIAAGLKYTFIADRESDFLMAAGARLELETGDEEVLQGEDIEFSPFISAAKGWGRFHTMACLTYRIPGDDDKGNQVLQWDLHFDYEIAPDVLPGLAPVVELHGLHYLTDGEALALDVGGLDYANLGSSNVAGDSVVWLGLGARWKLTAHLSVGCTYEFSLTDPEEDIMDERVTFDVMLTW